MTAFEIVPFNNTNLEALREGEDVWVSLRRMCEALEIDLKSQHRKLTTKPWAVMVMKTTTGSDGKAYETACLHLDAVPMWLAGIEPSRVKPAARPALERFQKECARVLRDHFFPHRAGSGGAQPSGAISIEQVAMGLTSAITVLAGVVTDTHANSVRIAEVASRLDNLDRRITNVSAQRSGGARVGGARPTNHQQRTLPLVEDPWVTLRKGCDGDIHRNIRHRFGVDTGGIHNHAVNGALKEKIQKARRDWTVDDYRKAVEIAEREFGFIMTMTRIALMAMGA